MDAEGSSDAEEARGGSKMLLRSLDYPCATRLRHRRLLAFLINNDYMDAYDEINKRRRLVFHVSDLEDLMKAGRLVEARNYVWRFAPPGGGGGEPSSSAEAVTLWKFIHQLMVLDSFAHGGIRDHTAIRGWFTRILAEPPGFSVLNPLVPRPRRPLRRRPRRGGQGHGGLEGGPLQGGQLGREDGARGAGDQVHHALAACPGQAQGLVPPDCFFEFSSEALCEGSTTGIIISSCSVLPEQEEEAAFSKSSRTIICQ
ncbi:uncharacterized protein [Oryza sativa Japonica Group]|nr:uncharacterized protein LOC107277025 isoform X2 [Oryza sativa Japonica Group]KAF2935830.1 hypothetical protein DAI22_04g259900 [Oryza sativa Japonica Group]